MIVTKENTTIANLVIDLVGMDSLMKYLASFIVLAIIIYNEGGSRLRRLFFGKQTAIWYSEIPSAIYLLIFCDAIKMARLSGDNLREDLLCFYLIDFARNPDQIFRITGSLIESRKQANLERLTKENELKSVWVG